MDNTALPLFIVLDSEPEARVQTARVVQTHGYPCLEFASGDQFFSSSLPLGPTCIIMDLMGSSPQGLEVQAWINLMNRPWPVVFHTATRCLATAIQALKAGALDFLLKHDNSNELAAILPWVAEEAAARFQQISRQEAYRQRYESLTASERSVLEMLLQGLLNKQIAARLDLTVRTIEMRRATIVKKMGVSSVMELIGVAARFEQTVQQPASVIPRHHFPSLPTAGYSGELPPPIAPTL